MFFGNTVTNDRYHDIFEQLKTVCADWDRELRRGTADSDCNPLTAKGAISVIEKEFYKMKSLTCGDGVSLKNIPHPK